MTSEASMIDSVPQSKAWLERVPVYTPGRSDIDGGAARAKLSSNENPLGPSPLAIAAYQKAASEIHRYPDGIAMALRTKIAARHGILADGIVCGNGSEDRPASGLAGLIGFDNHWQRQSTSVDHH